jgi:enoyl-CoA hydratase/carnithine racemase
MYRHLKLVCQQRCAYVTLDRPERRNAFSAELMREMIACAAALAARRDVDVVIVSGAGGVFSAGADLKDATRWAGGAALLEQRETTRLWGGGAGRAARP